jgi:site-specific DNA recombinase
MKAILYARVTTADQREASLDDQLRECADLCKREGFEVVGRETDHGMSGESSTRPGYQRVLRAIESGKADVAVAHELTRLWRSQAELATQIEQFEFAGRHVVTCDGVDTRRDGFEFLLAVKGAQAKTEVKRISTRVHRSIKGNALAGRSTGGRAYGYRSEPIYDPVRKDAYGRPEIVGATRVIDPETAPIVVRIFEMYVAGHSPRDIASRLNADGVPPPSASWRRSRSRTPKWLVATIRGVAERDTGFLKNPFSIGRVVCNRRQTKKRPRTGKRAARMRSNDERIVRDEPALRIVSDELWQRVKDRQKLQARDLGLSAAGETRKRRPGAGRPARYLLSGLLRCSVCGGTFTLRNGSCYQCVRHQDGGEHACALKLMVPRERVEHRILSCIETDLLNPARLAELEARYRAEAAKPVDHSQRIATLESEIQNLTNAIAKGLLSDALAARLQAAEAEKGRLVAAQEIAGSARRKLPSGSIERRAEQMREQLAKGGEVARHVLRDIFPDSIWLTPDDSGRFLWAVFDGGLRVALLEELMGVQYSRPEDFPLVVENSAESRRCFTRCRFT